MIAQETTEHVSAVTALSIGRLGIALETIAVNVYLSIDRR
jgi:hypothetical protein